MSESPLRPANFNTARGNPPTHGRTGYPTRDPLRESLPIDPLCEVEVGGYSQTGSANQVGTAWHDVIDHWLTSPASQDELRQRLRDKLTVMLADKDIVFDDEDESAGALVDMSLRMLDIFLVKVPRPGKTVAVEVPFSLELAHPVTAEILPVRFIGSIDALVVEDGAESIWELKTGKRKWNADALDWDQQTTSYKIAARELGRGGDLPLKLVLTTKAAQPDVQLERLVRHRRDERELVETVFSVHRAVEAGVDHPIRGWMCRTCAWAGACGG
jgi:hypothetical protein